MNQNILIITDSSSTISLKTAQHYNIWIMPLSLRRNDGQEFLDDLKTITSSQILRMKRDPEYKFSFQTACTPLGEMIKIIDRALEEYDKILILPISSRWSSQTEHLQTIAKQRSNRVFVANTQEFGFALEQLSINLARKRDRGADINELLEYANNYHNYCLSLYACKDISSLIESGRINRVIGKVIKFTKIIPIIRAEGTNSREAIVTNWSKVYEKFIDSINKTFGRIDASNIDEMAVLTTDDSNPDADKLKLLLADRYNFPIDRIKIRVAPSVFLVYVNEGALGVTIIANKKKEHTHKNKVN